MLTAVSCLVKTKGNQTFSASAKVSEHHTTIQLHPVCAAGVLLLSGGSHVHKPYQSSTEIRHSSPDVYRMLQLPQGKRELPPTPSAALGHSTAAETGRDPGQRSRDPAPALERSRMSRRNDITESSCEHRAARNSLLIISQVFF